MGQQLFYKPIDIFSPIGLETLKAYTKTHLKIRFI